MTFDGLVLRYIAELSDVKTQARLAGKGYLVIGAYWRKRMKKNREARERSYRLPYLNYLCDAELCEGPCPKPAHVATA